MKKLTIIMLVGWSVILGLIATIYGNFKTTIMAELATQQVNDSIIDLIWYRQLMFKNLIEVVLFTVWIIPVISFLTFIIIKENKK